MKNKIILSVYLILSLQLSFQELLTFSESSSKKMFSGTIEFTTRTDLTPCLFYKGEKLLTEKNGPVSWYEYSFYDTPETQTVFVVITNNLTHSTQIANTLAGLKVDAGSDYICYKLEAKRNVIEDENAILTWEIFDYKLIDNIVPLNSLIFLFDPSLVAGLKTQSWKSENIFRVIPTILIKTEISPEEIERALNIAHLAALDIKTVHTSNQSNINNIISVPKSI